MSTSWHSIDEPVRSPTRAAGLAAAPEHATAARLELVVEHEIAHRVVERVAEVPVVGVAQRQLVCRARDLGTRDEGVVGVHDHGLGRPFQQLVRMAGVPLVELVVAGHEHRGRATVGATGAADLLAHRSQRAGEPVEHHRVERADVDAELERAGGDDTAELARRELHLELAPFGGEVSGPIRGDRRGVGAAECHAAPARRARASPRAPRPCDSG